MRSVTHLAFTILDRLLETLLAVTLATMAAVVFANVVFRFVFQNALSWGDEVAQILLVWLTFLGAALALRDRAHYAFDYLVRNLPKRAEKTFAILSQLIAIAAILSLFYWSAEAAIGIRDWIMPATGISRSFVYGACPVGCLFMLAYAIRGLIRELRTERGASPPKPVDEDRVWRS